MPRPKPKRDVITRTLQDLNLSENEALLYGQMLKNPRSTVQKLTTHAPLPRTMLYYVLNQLIGKGLVFAKKEKQRTVYIAEDPERLYDLLAKKEQEFEREKSAIRELIPQLKKRYRLAGKRPNIRVFEGLEEYQKALEDIVVTKPKHIFAYEVLGARKSALEIRAAHERKRISLKIKKSLLFFDDKNAQRFLKGRQYDDFTEFRSISKDSIAPFEVDVTLYEGKLLYTSYSDEHEPTAILVEDQALYLMQKSLFDQLWRAGKDCTFAFTKSL